jgi:hypothetical protein
MSQLRSGREIAGDLTGQDLPVALGSPRRFETNVKPRRRLGVGSTSRHLAHRRDRSGPAAARAAPRRACSRPDISVLQADELPAQA